MADISKIKEHDENSDENDEEYVKKLMSGNDKMNKKLSLF